MPVHAGRLEERAAVLPMTAGSGRELFGTALPFNVPTPITEMDPDTGQRVTFNEVFLPGSIADGLREVWPKLLLNHGREAYAGSLPVGQFDDIQETRSGLEVRGTLFDSWLSDPVKAAVAAGEMGLSIRFRVPDGGDSWSRSNGVDVRTIRRALVPEISLTAFPAYVTQVAVRGGRPMSPTQRERELRRLGIIGAGIIGAGTAARLPQRALANAQARDRELRLRRIIR